MTFLTAKEVAALEAAEDEWTEAFNVVAGQVGRYVSSSERDKAIKRGVEAHSALQEVAAITYDKIEARRAAVIEECDEAEADALAELQGAALPRVRELLAVAGRAASMRAAAKDKNPHARHSAGRPAPKIPGGSLIDQLESAVETVGTLPVYYLDGAQLGRYQSGEPALDLYGNAVPPGLPASRVRMSYATTTLRDVAVRDLQGGVA